MPDVLGYARVSTSDQNLDGAAAPADPGSWGNRRVPRHRLRQELRSAGPERDARLLPGRRHDLRRARLGRSLKELLETIDLFEARGLLAFRSLEERLDTFSAACELVFNFFSAIAHFERRLIVERTRDGIIAARARGKVPGRPTLDTDKPASTLKLVEAGIRPPSGRQAARPRALNPVPRVGNDPPTDSSTPMLHNARFLIVSGPAAAGKTTIATKLVNELDLPLISKDAIKTAMRAAIGPDAISARQLGDAAVAVLMSIARQMNNGAIIDNVWRRDQAEALRKIPGFHVELFCFCDRSLLEERYAARVRPAGYLPEHSSRDDLWSPETMKPIGISPLISVDTAKPINFTSLTKSIEQSWALQCMRRPN